MLPPAIAGLMSLANDYDEFIYETIRIERALSLANGCL